MKDNDVIKALECCTQVDSDVCDDCPLYDKKIGCLEMDIRIPALDLINRQKAEIERLKAFEEKIAEYNSSIRVEDMLVFASSLGEWLEFCDNLKAEARKEFAERLKERKYVSSDWSHGEHPFVVEEVDIDEVLEEMESERE